MLVEIQKRKCLRCGHVFRHILGGIIYNPFPSCPKCKLPFTVKIGTYNDRGVL